jgi:hypothetical protein
MWLAVGLAVPVLLLGVGIGVIGAFPGVLSDEQRFELLRVWKPQSVHYGDTAIYFKEEAFVQFAVSPLLLMPQNVNEVHFSDCRTSRWALRDLLAISRLNQFEFWGCDIDDEKAEMICRRKGTLSLRLALCPVTSSSIKKLPDSLEELGLEETKVDDGIAGEVANLHNLKEAEFDNSPVGDEVAKALGHLRSLETVDLPGTLVTGAGIQALLESSNVVHLDVSRTGIGDESIDWIEQDKNLKFLNIRETRVTHARLVRLIQVWKDRNAEVALFSNETSIPELGIDGNHDVYGHVHVFSSWRDERRK